MKRNLILIRQVNNQHCIDELVYRINMKDGILYVHGEACEANKTNKTLGIHTWERTCNCHILNEPGILPCHGCEHIELVRHELETFIDFN